ncbi:hypothetical protein Hdeb2414_s0011g00362601 [Helianthus debilis subsp. tardiflorus]
MTDYEERYEGNDEDVETFHGGGSSPSAGANDDGGGGTEEFSDSKSQGLAVALLWDEARYQTSGKLTTSYYILILMELDNVVSSFQSSQVTLIYQGLWID